MAEGTEQQMEYQRQHVDDNLVAATFGVASSMAFLASLAVLLRLICRRRLKLQLSYDDYLIIFALVSGITLAFMLALAPAVC